MNLFGPIKEIMSTEIITLEPEDSVADAGNIFHEFKIHHIPIVKEGKLVGMVSKSDFLFFKNGFLSDKIDIRIEEVRLNNYDVKDIMTTGLACLEPEDRINVALELFKENIFHAIPITKDDKLVGIITTLDIIRRIAEDQEAHQSYE